ncbi:retrotransposon protein, putative, ty1-copia subclass [Tanacetum coccineum]
MLQDVKSYLGRCFAMKDLGEATYILGIKIYKDRSKRLIGLCQRAYIDKIFKRFYMENSKRGSIPMQEKLKLNKFQGASTLAKVKRMQNIPYASAVGSKAVKLASLHDLTISIRSYDLDLAKTKTIPDRIAILTAWVGSIMYAIRCTRPDVAFAQNIRSRFQQNPELRVSCYTDAGYLTDADDLKSQTGYVFVLNGGAVDLKSTKQSIFVTSSAKAEYIAAYDASKEAVWIRKFIFGLGIVPIIKEPIKMYCDNTEAITIANESVITKRARHYRAKFITFVKLLNWAMERISKKRTKNKAKTTKPDTEWKSVEKTKSRQSPSDPKSTPTNPKSKSEEK